MIRAKQNTKVKDQLKVADKNTVEPYSWGDRSAAWPLLESESLSVKQELMAAGSTESLHLHRRSQQFFYVLDGQAVMEIGSERYYLKPGQGIRVPPGQGHRIINETKEPLEFLVISAPTTKQDREQID